MDLLYTHVRACIINEQIKCNIIQYSCTVDHEHLGFSSQKYHSNINPNLYLHDSFAALVRHSVIHQLLTTTYYQPVDSTNY